MWLLAVVLPLQGAAVGVFAVMGPSHIHAPAEPSLLSADFRRWRPSPEPATHVSTWFGHGHAHAHAHATAAPQRHFHDPLEGGVVPTGDTHSSGLEADEPRGANLSPASLLAMLPAVPAWAPDAGLGALADRPRWASRTGFTEPLERPPRHG